MSDERKTTDAKTGMAAVGIGVLAVACCAAGPLLLASIGSIAVGATLGLVAGVLALVGLIAVLIARSRRRRERAARQGPLRA